MRHSLNWILICVPIMIPRSSIGMDVTAATESSDAATYAEDLLDECSPISLESADFLIDLVGGGTVESEFRSVASFSNGNEGGPLPTINQLNPQDPVSFSGGIGLDCGICLCTGVVTDADIDGANAIAGTAVGVQGPNNGFPLTAYFDPPPTPSSEPLNAGELSFLTDKPRDCDLAAAKTVMADNEGDATVLQFEINIASPGFLRISFVFASDEHPHWIDSESMLDVNDTMAIFIRQESCPNGEFKNFALLRMPGQADQPMSLRELSNCGDKMFHDNQVVPAPNVDLIPCPASDGTGIFLHGR